MKTLLHTLILSGALVACTALASCEQNISGKDDIIYDFAGVGVTIELVDADGNNLLSPDTDGNLLGADMYMMCDDKTFTVSWDNFLFDQEHLSRYNLAKFSGLTCHPRMVWNGSAWVSQKNDNILHFGDFSGHSSQHKKMVFGIEKINAVWNIDLDYDLKWVNGEPEVYKTIKVNSQPVENGTITLVI